MGVRKLVLESRNDTHDKRDRELLVSMRRRGEALNFDLEHVPGKDEPLLWVPDQILGAYGEVITRGASRKWEDSWRRVERTLDVREVPTRERESRGPRYAGLPALTSVPPRGWLLMTVYPRTGAPCQESPRTAERQLARQYRQHQAISIRIKKCQGIAPGSWNLGSRLSSSFISHYARSYTSFSSALPQAPRPPPCSRSAACSRPS